MRGNCYSLPSVSGARCVATLLHEMKRRGKDCRFGIVSMCIGLFLFLAPFSLFSLSATRFVLNVFASWPTGSGMGAAAVFERGDCVDDLCNARTVRDNNLLSMDAL